MNRNILIWLGLFALMAFPVIRAISNPYLPFRETSYIIAGFAGIFCLSIFVLQPLLATRRIPLHPFRARRLHRIVGICVLSLTIIHVAGLFVTNSDDVIDVFMLRAPTTFSIFGVIAFWGIILTGLIATLRHSLPSFIWRKTHQTLSCIVISATIIHALQIQGAMEPISKWIICLAAILSTVVALIWQKQRT